MLKKIAFAFSFVVLLAITPVYAGSMTLLGVGSSPAPATYQGPGDVTSGWAMWFSTARVLTAAQANTSTLLADLVDPAAPTTVICTLRGSASGQVDLSAYCPGGLTPSAKCAAISPGHVCNVSQLYDLTGFGHHAVQTTAGNQPQLTFSALNGLPAITCVAANNTFMSPGGTAVSSSQPYFTSAVYIRSSGTAEGAIFAYNSGTVFWLEAASGTSLVGIANAPNANQTAPATDAAYHAVNAVYNGASSAINVDGSSTSASGLGTNALASNTFRICRGPSGVPATLQGNILEVGFGLGSGNSSGVNSNQHGPNGYNF